LAIRAASGHSLIDILDPERISARISSRIGMYLAGVFHVTTWDKLESIFRKGLHPGGFAERIPRMDSHFTPFFPTDRRNSYMGKRLENAARFSEKLVVLSYDQEGFFQYPIRLCQANGFLLTRHIIPSTLINMVYELRREVHGWECVVLYHPRAADYILSGCRGGRPATPMKIAQLLTNDEGIQSAICHECQDISKKYVHWRTARNQLMS